MKHTSRTVHTIYHKVELTGEEVHRMICKAVLAPENALVGSINNEGDIVVEWEVIKEEPVFVPPTAMIEIEMNALRK
jgi:hypothetical protein